MKITRIDVHQVTLPLKKPYRLSGGRLLFEALDSTIVRVQTDQGLDGWGEGCPWGATYLPAFGKGVRAEGDVRLHSSIPTGTPAEMLDSIAAAREKGYAIHSCKIGSGVDEDIDCIVTISEGVPGGESLTWDVNRAWLRDDAIQVMQATRELGGYFEQPCESYEECLAVRRCTTQPIILDECIHSYTELVRARNDAAMEVANLKLGRVGGLTRARRMRDFCVATGLRTNIEDTGGSVIADTAAVHLAQSTPASHRRATWLCHDMIGVDCADGGARNEEGISRAPTAPGLGVSPRAEILGDPIAVYQ